MKTTIYELLGMIKDGKFVKRVLFRNKVYEYDEDGKDYFNEEDGWLLDGYSTLTILNEPIEILETTIAHKPDKIEKITGLIQIDNEYNGETDDYDIDRIDEYRIGRDDDRILKDLAYTILEIQRKINEIIDFINKDQK